MCLSPDEMTTEQLEHEITELRKWARATRDRDRADFWNARADNMELVLKERAEEGTI